VKSSQQTSRECAMRAPGYRPAHSGKDSSMFEGFERSRVEAEGANINAVRGGESPLVVPPRTDIFIWMREITHCGKGEGLGKRSRQYPGPLLYPLLFLVSEKPVCRKPGE
jgi:hypothetical protein